MNTAIFTANQTFLPEDCIDSTHEQWRKTINTLNSVTLLSCLRLYKEPGCKGPYVDHTSSEITEESFKSAFSMSACPLTASTEHHRIRRALPNQKTDYEAFQWFFARIRRPFFPGFREHISSNYSKVRNWTFFLNETVEDKHEEYIKAVEVIKDFFIGALQNKTDWAMIQRHGKPLRNMRARVEHLILRVDNDLHEDLVKNGPNDEYFKMLKCMRPWRNLQSVLDRVYIEWFKARTRGVYEMKKDKAEQVKKWHDDRRKYKERKANLRREKENMSWYDPDEWFFTKWRRYQV